MKDLQKVLAKISKDLKATANELDLLAQKVSGPQKVQQRKTKSSAKKKSG